MGVRGVRQNWARNSVLARFGSKILDRRELSLGGFWGREGGREPGLGARPDWRANGRAGSGHRSIGGGRDWALVESRLAAVAADATAAAGIRRRPRPRVGARRSSSERLGRSRRMTDTLGRAIADLLNGHGGGGAAAHGVGGRRQAAGPGEGGVDNTQHGTQGAGHAGRLALDSGVRASWRADQPSGRAPRTGIPGEAGGVGCVWRRPCL